MKIEENTPFYEVQNKLKLADDDMQAEMYLRAVEMLDSLGYKQYEISNFAKQGYESRHNTNYWRCGEYIGIGPSAHSFLRAKGSFIREAWTILITISCLLKVRAEMRRNLLCSLSG